MPKSHKPRPGPDAPDLPDVDPPVEVGSGSDLGAIMAAIKQTEQNVLAKIDSSVMAAAGELHKKIDNLASDFKDRNPECARLRRLLKKHRKKAPHYQPALMILRRKLMARLTVL